MTDVEIAALESELRAAQLSADVAALDHLISDDLLFTGPDGALATKAQDLAAYREGVMRVTSQTAQMPDGVRRRPLSLRSCAVRHFARAGI